MPNIDKIRENLSSYKTLIKRQGDFTIYASKYIQDVEALLSAVEPKKSAPVATDKPTTGKTRRVRKAVEPKESND